MDNPYPECPPPRWACALGLVQVVIVAVLLTLHLL